MYRLLGFGIVPLVVFALWLYCIFDVIASDEALVRNLPRGLWLLLVIVLPTIGSVAWLALGRPLYASWRPGDTRTRSAPPPDPSAPRTHPRTRPGPLTITRNVSGPGRRTSAGGSGNSAPTATTESGRPPVKSAADQDFLRTCLRNWVGAGVGFTRLARPRSSRGITYTGEDFLNGGNCEKSSRRRCRGYHHADRAWGRVRRPAAARPPASLLDHPGDSARGKRGHGALYAPGPLSPTGSGNG